MSRRVGSNPTSSATRRIKHNGTATAWKAVHVQACRGSSPLFSANNFVVQEEERLPVGKCVALTASTEVCENQACRPTGRPVIAGNMQP